MKKIISLGITLAVIALIYSRADLAALEGMIINAHPGYLLLALASFGVHFLLSGWRWTIIARPYCPISIPESIRFIIACSPFNLILPAKTGSFAKAFFMNEAGYMKLQPALSMAFYEKLSDIAALGFIFTVSFLLVPTANPLIVMVLTAVSFFLILYLVIHIANPKLFKALNIVFSYITPAKKQKVRLPAVNLISIAIWVNSIVQFLFFFKMFHLQVPASAIFLKIPCAIFVGIIPITILGIGTRDAAIIYLFKGLLSYNEAVSIGMVSALRYLFPALIGLPFFIISMFKRKAVFSLREEPQS